MSQQSLRKQLFVQYFCQALTAERSPSGSQKSLVGFLSFPKRNKCIHGRTICIYVLELCRPGAFTFLSILTQTVKISDHKLIMELSSYFQLTRLRSLSMLFTSASFCIAKNTQFSRHLIAGLNLVLSNPLSQN